MNKPLALIAATAALAFLSAPTMAKPPEAPTTAKSSVDAPPGKGKHGGKKHHGKHHHKHQKTGTAPANPSTGS